MKPLSPSLSSPLPAMTLRPRLAPGVSGRQPFGDFLPESGPAPVSLPLLPVAVVPHDVTTIAAHTSAALACRALPTPLVAPERERERETRRSDETTTMATMATIATMATMATTPPFTDVGPASVAPMPPHEVAGVQQAADLIDDPALHISLDLNNALVIVDGLHIRLSTHDGAASVSVSGKHADIVVDRQLELRQALRTEGLTLQMVQTAGAGSDTNNDRHGRAVVDVQDAPPRPSAPIDAYEQVSVRVHA